MHEFITFSSLAGVLRRGRDYMQNRYKQPKQNQTGFIFRKAKWFIRSSLHPQQNILPIQFNYE